MRLEDDANLGFVHLNSVPGIRPLANRFDGQIAKGIKPETPFQIFSDLGLIRIEVFLGQTEYSGLAHFFNGASSGDFLI